MSREGLFLEVPALPEGEAGLAEAERLGGVGLRPRLAGPPGEWTKEEIRARNREVDWPYLQGVLRVAVAAWFASIEAEHRARMDPRLLARFPSDQAPPVAEAALRGVLYELLNSPFTIGAFGLDGAYRIALVPRFLDHVVIGQLLEAIRDRLAYRVCDHCGRPFAYTSERARFCSGSCKTLAWRKRKEEGGK